MSFWFVKSSAGLRGPMPKNEILDGIKSGHFAWFDLAIEADGVDRKWRALIAVGELRSAAALAPANEKSRSDEKLWVVRRLPNGSLRGPFSLSMVKERLRAGEISYSDSICSYGGESWQRIGDVNEFQATHEAFSAPVEVKSVEVAPISSYELSQSIVRSRGIKVLDSETPPEAMGDDLVETPQWMRFIGLVFALLAGWSSAEAATALKIVPLKLQSSSPALLFETDATMDEAIEIDLIGQSGDVLDVLSVSHRAVIKRSAGEVATLNLKGLKLPVGKYLIRAAIGSLKVEESIFVGVRDGDFLAKLERHQKQISQQQGDEKRLIYYSARGFERLAVELNAGFKAHKTQKTRWKDFYSNWRNEFAKVRKSLQPVSGAKVAAFPEFLKNLESSGKRLERVAQDLDRAVQQAREPASETGTGAAAIASEFAGLKSEAGRLSGRD